MKTLRAALLACVMLSVPAPGVAQIDISGTWGDLPYGDSLHYNPGNGPTPVDYLGLPLSESGRARALELEYGAYMSGEDRLCALYSSVYMMLGPQDIRLWSESDPRSGAIVSWNISFGGVIAPITIWMDGRPHPSKYAPHTETGFTTGTWEDDVLVTSTTHLKASVVRRNGAQHSDQATMRTRFVRHGDVLTVMARVEDPAYLDGPYYLTKNYQLTGGPPLRIGGPPCPAQSEGVPAGTVRFHPPGQNPFLNEMTELYNLPVETVLGGVETMYPEYRKTLKDKYVRPEKCNTPNHRANVIGCGGPGTYPRMPR